MIRRPPKSTRTDTLFPYTTLFRSWFIEAEIAQPHFVEFQPFGSHRLLGVDVDAMADFGDLRSDAATADLEPIRPPRQQRGVVHPQHMGLALNCHRPRIARRRDHIAAAAIALAVHNPGDRLPGHRSEERLVGQEWVRSCSTRWSP